MILVGLYGSISALFSNSKTIGDSLISLFIFTGDVVILLLVVFIGVEVALEGVGIGVVVVVDVVGKGESNSSFSPNNPIFSISSPSSSSISSSSRWWWWWWWGWTSCFFSGVILGWTVLEADEEEDDENANVSSEGIPSESTHIPLPSKSKASSVGNCVVFLNLDYYYIIIF